ncbi:MAG: DUF1579 family protein [Candidatus Zixiibacteriota bacterium]
MKGKFITLFILAAAFICAALVTAQEPMTPEKQAEMQQKAMELAQPGPEHQKLAELAGNWTYTFKMWMSPAETNPMIAGGKAEAKTAIGGRFLQLNYSGTFMGMPFEGFSVMGFDRRSSEYTSVGFDNMGTYWVSAQGPADKETGVITMVGKDYDAFFKHTQEYKFVMELKSKDQFTFAVIFTDPITSQGTGNFKMVEIEYNRAK